MQKTLLITSQGLILNENLEGKVPYPIPHSPEAASAPTLGLDWNQHLQEGKDPMPHSLLTPHPIPTWARLPPRILFVISY